MNLLKQQEQQVNLKQGFYGLQKGLEEESSVN